MKKFLSILLAVVLCFSVCSVAAFAAGEDIVVKAVPSKTTLNKGDTFTVDFNITTNAGFNTLGLEVGYDNAVLEVVCPNHKDGSNCTSKRSPVTNMLEESPDGAANNATNSKTHDVNPYKIMWAFGTAEEDVVDTGRIATLTFKVKADAKFGKTTISLEVDQAAGIENGAYAANEFAGVSADVTVACSTHIKNEGTVTKEPTCTAKGTKAYKCSECGADMGTEDIKATGHSYGAWSVTTEPTCTAKGQETRVCANDASHKENRDVNPTGHDWGNWEGTADAKCGEKGEETRVCKNDANHKETRDTNALEHLWDNGTVTKAPTCTEKGTKTFKCTRTDCDGTKTEDVKATGHNYGDWAVTTEPTCEDKGEETRVCANDAAHKETRDVKAIGHDFDYENPVVTEEPTCTEEGEEEYECLNGCGEVETGVVDALGHTIEWDITKEATLDEEGERTGICEVCEEEVTEVIPKLTTVLEGDKLGFIVIDEETGEITYAPADGFKVESGDDEPFSGYVQGEIMAVTPEGEDAETVDGKTVAVGYIVALTNTDTEEIVDMDKVITLTIPVSNDILSAYENLVLIGVDENGEDVIIEGAEFVDGAFVVTGKYSELAMVAVAGDKIVVEEDDKDPIVDNEDDKDDETTSPATGDTAAVAFVIVMLAIAASVLVFTSKKVRA